MKWCLVFQSLTLVLVGLMAGFFYAFSVTVMPGLDLADPVTAIKAMNAINSAVRNPVFFFTFFGTPIIACVAAAMSFFRGQRRMSWLIGSGAIVYVLGVIAPTASVNVPMNEALLLFEIESSWDSAATAWADYSSVWTRWNTLRACVCTACLGVLALSLTPGHSDRNGSGDKTSSLRE